MRESGCPREGGTGRCPEEERPSLGSDDEEEKMAAAISREAEGNWQEKRAGEIRVSLAF